MARGLQFLERRERFLPFQQAELQQRMLSDERLSAAEREQLGVLFELVADRFHFEFRKKLERLKELYDPFDPDNESPLKGGDPADEAARRQQLAQAYQQLLLDANYVEMPPRQIVACAQYQSQTGLVLTANLSDYAELQIFYRGIRQEERTCRSLLFPWKQKGEALHVFSRLAMLVRLTGSRSGPVFLKLFKDVVAEDLEMVLPYVKIRMRLLDHVKIGSSVAGGVVTAGGKVFAAAISPWVFLLVLSGFIGAIIRGVFSFFSNKTRYMQALSTSLYFQNLANNSSALAYLVDAAEAEECKELLLAYYLLYVERDHDYTQEGLDRRVQQWLQAEFGLKVDFEVPEAVQELLDKRLLVRRPPAGEGSPNSASVLKVYDLPSALRRLDEVWDNYSSYSRTRSSHQDRLADVNWPAYPEPLTQARAAETMVG